jgi:hypothetical protein
MNPPFRPHAVLINNANSDNEEDEQTDSYFDRDIADYEVQGMRHKSITLPVEEEEFLDGRLPIISEIIY